MGEEQDPIRPSYYQGTYVDEVIEAFGLGFRLGNAIKYILRADNKDRDRDLRKAVWYIERELARREAHAQGGNRLPQVPGAYTLAPEPALVAPEQANRGWVRQGQTMSVRNVETGETRSPGDKSYEIAQNLSGGWDAQRKVTPP